MWTGVPKSQWRIPGWHLGQPDALLIASDIFDMVTPPVKAQEQLYDFIV